MNDIEELVNEVLSMDFQEPQKTKEELIAEINTMVEKLSMEEIIEVYLFIGNNY